MVQASRKTGDVAALDQPRERLVCRIPAGEIEEVLGSKYFAATVGAYAV
jgi:hypothetical protein